MSNWYGQGRSNYFRVKDRAAFDAWLATVPDVTLCEGDSSEERTAGKVALFPEGEYGEWPSSRYVEEPGEDEDQPFEILDELAPHLAEGEVAILMEVGHEKARYVTGWAEAVNWKGERVGVSLNDIYKLAEKAWGVKPTAASY